MIHQNVSTIEDCRNLCCKKHHICASWTLSLEENTCLLRKEHEPTVERNLNEVSGVTKRDGMSTPHRNKKLRFYIGILSAPNNLDRRNLVRKKCIPNLQRNNLDLDQLKFDFVIARPHGSLSRSRANKDAVHKKEAETTEKLWKEHQEFGDIAFIPERDTYVDLPTKTLETMRLGVLHGAHYIIKVDDDKCPHIANLMKVIEKQKHPKYTYIGAYFWGQKYYTSQKGFDGGFVPYMSGWVYALSFSLAKLITFADLNYASLYPMYGSSSEDVDMGRWVAHAKDTHNVPVKYIAKDLGGYGHEIK